MTSSNKQKTGPTAGPGAAALRRDSARTRQRLIAAAMKRFAEQGYSAARVRDIGGDAGVDPALINRYFDSKEGLFEACLATASDMLLLSTEGVSDLSRLPEIMSLRTADAVPQSGPEDGITSAVALILRPTGNERAEKMRLDMLGSFSRSLTRLAGTTPEEQSEELLFRAELVIAVGIGVATLRSSGLEPLASASSDRLRDAFGKLVRLLLPET
jgi:AcrR family transcriptional regulator